jgi:hypothetical protein
MSTSTEAGQRRRRRVRLTPLQSIPIEFAGERGGEGPLTLGQLNVYIWLSQIPDHVYAILRAELPVPTVVSVDDVAEATAALIERHESLRTTIVPGEQPRQRVAAAGLQLLEVCSLGEGQWGPKDRPAVAEALIQWLRESPDPGRRQVRMVVAIAPDAGDQVIACAAAFGLVFRLLSSNRFERHLVNYVGSLAQDAIATVEISGRSFDELVRHTWATVMEASRHGRYDEAKRTALDRLTEHERGLSFSPDPLFNSLVPESWSGLTAGVGFQPEEIDAALARTGLRWRPMPGNETPIRFSLNQIDSCLRLDMWSGDTGLVPRAELDSVLLAVERLLVAAAHDDVASDRIPGVIRLEPLPRTPDQILIDHCWTDLADVQRLVDDALAPAVAHVFASVGASPLVAHLTATDTVRTPEEAHARCMAVLANHPTAITPRHYVICRTAPSDPADPAAWPVPLATGTGRACNR